MCDLDPRSLSQEERENIIFKLIEASYDLRSAGIRHSDVHPRNVIIASTSVYDDPDLRVVLIDFGLSRAYRFMGLQSHPRHLHNPCFAWASSSMWSWWGWLPFRDEDRIDWVWKYWSTGRDGKYVAVERDPSSRVGKLKKPRLRRQEAREPCNEESGSQRCREGKCSSNRSQALPELLDLPR